MHTISVPLGDAVHTKRSLCAICGMHRKTAPFALTHGIVVRLCVVHRSIEYLRRSSGRAFADQLRQSWRAHGALTSRRRAALATHPRRVLSALRGEGLPGSYAWRSLRLEAEARFGAGDDPAKVIDELRRRERDGPARCPSYRSMRRWFMEARWLAPARATAPRPSPGEGGVPARWPTRPVTPPPGGVAPALPPPGRE